MRPQEAKGETKLLAAEATAAEDAVAFKPSAPAATPPTGHPKGIQEGKTRGT